MRVNGVNCKMREGEIMNFKDRADGGRQLAKKLSQYKNDKRAIVIGLPRGGVVTAFEVAKALGLDLDIIVTRKIGAPTQPELAVGALTQDGEPLLDQDLMETLISSGFVGVDDFPLSQNQRVNNHNPAKTNAIQNHHDDDCSTVLIITVFCILLSLLIGGACVAAICPEAGLISTC